MIVEFLTRPAPLPASPLELRTELKKFKIFLSPFKSNLKTKLKIYQTEIDLLAIKRRAFTLHKLILKI